MTFHLLDGKALANEIKDEIATEIEELGVQPTLSSILVGGDPASKLYMKLQKQACEEVGITVDEHFLDASIQQTEVLTLLRNLNVNEQVNGIVVQLPLPVGFETDRIVREIDLLKDVDGVTPTNLGKLMQGEEILVPATPKGILRLLANYEIDFKGQEVVIVNHSIVVGKPLSILCLNRNATVTVCHVYTRELKPHTRLADILVTATGVPNLIKPDMVKEGVIVVDAGISRTDDGIVGDVAFEGVKEKASYISPVPGGVGPMTIASLLENVVHACRLQNRRR
ncbi:MAG: bifunctional 5,10-methylenetetrahydrofolate dehydrogenase/5,10-methenyltetrahydrofolate cyclohydrolase [Candidatus Korarchaeota archaeon]|nr:bifunctional 5,10-methylenetetrahydrofolate dehydrogenase/5,10-methenyltetrahydrofolate cyclohydrolase [Candidatus Korarchaeota archaeon]NIU84894.1 bifunctional methylenetetrahydrofolate dehydrogenase/methenyltetrahydrofolate cyclohydrolase [Candidatus Thorarchaeota archaeon]NIW14920.1 bifunctional methylenetetrahydrofolate dehydrogenase/methenyltetrahydrofolate cyclohydrolase [Candidatus Thorarchaeota archaeon]NIW52954.1 bifunctional methylenetetrahydrofolate dehydrogenase/methenyltetrahydro